MSHCSSTPGVPKDDETRMLVEEIAVGSDVGAKRKEGGLELHLVEDGGVAEFDGGVGVGEKPGVMEEGGGFVVVGLEESEAVGEDEGLVWVEAGGCEAGVAG